MSELNVANRTLAIMDNLPFLRSLNNECIDLIAIDPPFAAKETFTAKPKPPITEAELTEEWELASLRGISHYEGIGETRVKDVWSWDKDIHPDWKMQIEDDYPAVHAVIQAVEACATENEAAYIAFMAVRLIECWRVLKSTGSIYVHCDYHANSYLRMLMDAIFGLRNFRNEIVWCYAGGGQPQKDFPRKHDTILRYSKSDFYTFNKIRVPYDSDYEATVFVRNDSRAPGRTYRPHPDGKVIEDWWRNLPRPYGKEHTGYATQKPLALYERIITASSNPSDIVLDIFAGCATTTVAAERLGRKWIACDMAYRSWTMLKRRFYLNGFALTDMTDSTRNALGEHQIELQESESYTIGPNNLPKRDDTDPVPFHQLQQARGSKKTTQTASWSGRISKEDAKKILIDRFGPVCWGCGYQPQRPNGSLDLTLLEVDHIRARKASEGKQGGDELFNLAMLHRTCNGIKKNKLTLEELRTHNAHNGLLYVNGLRDLVDLYEAMEFATDQIQMYVARHGYQQSLSKSE